MIVAVHQPQFLPWLGYFDKIIRADRFVILDTVQYKKNEFQNRNRIKTAQGWQWLTVPVRYKFPQTIEEVTINNDVNWRHKHIQSLRSNYTRSPFFQEHVPFLEELYEKEWSNLSDLNLHTVLGLMNLMGVTTPVDRVTHWDLSNDPTGRLVDICRKTDASTYLSGAGGQDYLDMAQFDSAGIEVIFQDFTHPEYPQQFGQFEPFMSTIDLLLNVGPNCLDTIRSGSLK